MASWLIDVEMAKTVVILLGLITLSASDDSVLLPQHSRRMVCHMRIKDGGFTVPDAEYVLPMCTHLVYNYLHITSSLSSGFFVLNTTRDFQEEGITQMVAFKEKFPYLKTMIGVGGPGDERTYYSMMAMTAKNREIFVASVSKFVLENNLDGADLHWPTPGERDEDKANFVLLAKEFRQQFDKNFLIFSLTLTGTVSSSYRGVEPTALGEQAHFLNLLTFDYRTSNGQVAFLSPMQSKTKFDLETASLFYEQVGVKPVKLNLGVSSNAILYFLEDDNVTGSPIGLPYRKRSLIGENLLCKLREEGDWVEHWDEEAASPYSQKGAEVVCHENRKSLATKAVVVMARGMGGISYYGLDTDDFRGDCLASRGKFPVLRDIDAGLTSESGWQYTELLQSIGSYNARFFWIGKNYTAWAEDQRDLYTS